MPLCEGRGEDLSKGTWALGRSAAIPASCETLDGPRTCVAPQGRQVGQKSAITGSTDAALWLAPRVSPVIHSIMDHISVRELRNNGGRVLQRVANGETLTVTLDGTPVAELRPLTGRGVPAAELLRRWRRLPHVDGASLRAQIDASIDTAL